MNNPSVANRGALLGRDSRCAGRDAGDVAGSVDPGAPGRDVICARGGADRVNGLGSKDIIRGGAGNDRLVDKAGKRDRLLGQRGKDTPNAKDGQRGDLLIGGPRRDNAFKDRGDWARSI
jgi:Ca2+-binding RTX toxin-like protein